MVLIFLVCFMLFQVYEQYRIAQETAQTRTETEQTFSRLQSQKENLKQQVDELQDDYGVEAAIRRSFDVAREGEEVVIILEDTVNAVPRRARSTHTSTKNDKATSSSSFWFW
jgi:cell division protein FtsB